MAAIFGYVEPLRILCTREFQVSIKESMHAELKAAIESEPWLAANYTVGESFIRGRNGTEFLFRGLRHNIGSIKSIAHIDICIIEEAEDVPEHSWVGLIPTIRAERSELWPIWNPRSEESPVHLRFRERFDPDAMRVAEINYRDNPWFPRVLEEERQRDERNMDPGVYAHIWEGQFLKNSDAQVLKGKFRIAEFDDPDGSVDGPYYGSDWGFAQDPTTLNAVFIKGRTLYVWHEAHAVGCEITDIPELFDRVPGARTHTIRADSARPETISHVRKAGYKITAAKKWTGSVEDGIAWFRSFDEIVIHPRCKKTAEEARLWSYKKDRLTGDVLPTLVPGHDHHWDGIRYACAPIIQASKRKGRPRIRSL
jgi:phage terminase large subunit